MRYTQLLERLFQVKTTKTNSIKMVFKCHFNAIRFYSKLNRFVLSPRKKNEPLRFKNSSGWFCGLYTNYQSLNKHMYSYQPYRNKTHLSS